MQCGFDLALTRAVADAVRIPVITSGGVGNLRRVDGIKDGRADAIVGRGIFSLRHVYGAKAKAFMAEQQGSVICVGIR